MHHAILFPFALAAVLSARAQTDPLKTLPVWKAGEKRQVSINTTVNARTDSASFTTTMRSTYVLQVVSVRKDGYVLAVRTLGTDRLLHEMELADFVNGRRPDSLARFLQERTQDLYGTLNGLETRYDIAITGQPGEQVDAVGDVEKLRPAMVKAVTGLMDAEAAFKGRPSEALPQARANYLTDSLYAVMAHAQLQDLAELMRVYGGAFPATGSQRERVQVKLARTPLLQPYPEVAAMVESGLDRSDAKRMTCRTITAYDPAAVLAGMPRNERTAALRPQDVSWTEERVVDFDRTGGWPVASTSEIDLRVGAMKAHSTVKAAFEPVRP